MIYAQDPLRRRPRKSTARQKRRDRCVWMTENMGKWPSGPGKFEKSGHQLVAEKILFPCQLYSGIISANL